MKKLKKLQAILTAIALTAVSAISLTAMADQTGSITFKDGNETDTYAAYRLLNASRSNYGGQDALTYTVNSDYEMILQEITGKSSETEIIAVLEGYADDSDELIDFSEKVYRKIAENGIAADAIGNGKSGLTGLPYGYYLLKDTTENSEYVSHHIINSVVDGDIMINRKADKVPTLTKKIIDNGVYVDSVMAEIGEEVTFSIKTDVPAKVDTYTIHDTLDSGLTIPENVTVKITSHGQTETVAADHYELRTEGLEDECSMEIVFIGDYLKDKEGAVLESIYVCTVKSDAVIGETGNLNEASLEYNNDPYSDSTNKTTTDQNKVYTIELDIKKIGKEAVALPGAEFKLYRDPEATQEVKLEKKDGSYVVSENGTEDIVTGEDGIFKIKGLSDGTYYLKETVAPTGYKKLLDMVKIVITTEVPEEISDGTETLVSLEAEASIGDESVNVTATANTGIISFNVSNTAGQLLPTTGGMGTVVFYLAGLLIMTIAGINIFKSMKRKA